MTIPEIIDRLLLVAKANRETGRNITPTCEIAAAALGRLEAENARLRERLEAKNDA